MQTTSPVIELKNICFSYHKREVLHNVSFKTYSNEMTAIVGPNGGGKTTLLHLILGLLTPKHGQIKLLNGTPADTRTNVGYVPQTLSFDPKFPATALDVVLMGMIHIKQLNRKQKKDRAESCLNKTDCKHLIDRPFSSLSGGERQRVLIAQALVGSPQLLILDEPTANVDPKSEHEIYELFGTLNESIPIVFVSHNLSVVSKHVSHVICVNHTANSHPINEVMGSTLTELYGGKLAMLNHGQNCHITDPSHALNTPHKEQGNCCQTIDEV